MKKTYFVYIMSNVSKMLYTDAREKQIKGWLRAKKVALIESMNPEWKELAPEWMKKPRPAARCHLEANR